MIEENFKSNIEIYDLYYYDKDNSTEFNIEKASVNEENLFRVYQNLKPLKECKSLAFYGDRIEISNTLSKLFKQKIQINRIKEYPATLWCLLGEDTCFFILACETDTLFIPKPFNRESLVVTLQRFLQDLCKDIIVLPGENVLKDWSFTDKNPFFGMINNMDVEIIYNNDVKLEIERENLECNFEPSVIDSSGSLILENNYSKKFFKINKNEEKDKNSEKYNLMIEKIFQEQIKFERNNITSHFTKLQQNYPGLLEERLLLSFCAELEQFSFKVAELENSFCHTCFYNEIENFLKEVGDQRYGLIFGSRIDIDKDVNYRELAKGSLRWAMKNFIIYENGEIKCNYDNIVSIYVDITNTLCRQLSSEKLKKINIDKIKKNAYDFLSDNFVKVLKPNFKKYLLTGLMQLLDELQNYLVKQRDYFISINKSAARYFEIHQYLSNNVLNEGTKKFIINLFNDRSKKLIIDDKMLSEKLLKDTKIEDPIKNCELVSIFPTNTETNIIIMKLKSPSSLQKHSYSYFYLIFSAFGENVRKITDIVLNNGYFHFYPDENILYIFDYEKLDILKFKLEDGRLTKLQEFNYKDPRLGFIQSCVYIPRLTKFIIVNTDGKVFHLSGTDEFVARSLKKCIIRNERDRPVEEPMASKSLTPYNEVLYTGSGEYYALKYKNGIDFYNLDNRYESKNCLEMENIKYVKLFTDRINTYLVIFTPGRVISKLLPKCGANYEFRESSDQANDIKGNPIVDFIYSGFLKFGQSRGFNNHYYHFYNEKIYNTEILNYTKELFNGTSMIVNHLRSLNDIKELVNDNTFTHDMVIRLIRILLSRVPIQLCTLENENIIPLIDGKRINFSDNFSRMKKIEEKAKFLSFGYIENLLKDINDPVFLCCVIGKQSSGKSYLMNRIFDTRFDVRTTRCTDGIWMSYSYIEGNIIIVFDCEGLFSKQRKEIEEVKLLTFLAGVSDFTYLNQDLTFNRHLNNLLTNLSNSIGRLKGSNLFKGKLIWTVRDVRSSEKDGAYKEFKSHIDSFQREGLTFLKELFDSKIKFTCLNNFENTLFNSEIDNCRNDVLKEIKLRSDNKMTHWLSGSELMKHIKLLIVQLYTDDNTDVDLLGQEFTLNEIRENLIEIWEDPRKYTGTFNMTNKFTFTLGGVTKTINYNIEDIILEFVGSQFDINNIINFYKKALNAVGFRYSKQIHKDYYINCNEFLTGFINIRKTFIKTAMNDELAKIPNFLPEKKNNFTRDFENNVIANINYVLCLNLCHKCNLECIKPKNHRKIKEERFDEIKKELLDLQDQEIGDVEKELEFLASLKNEITDLNMKKKDKMMEELILERISDFQLGVKNFVESVEQIDKEVEGDELNVIRYRGVIDAIESGNPVYYLLSSLIEDVNKKIVFLEDSEGFKFSTIYGTSLREEVNVLLENVQNELEKYSEFINPHVGFEKSKECRDLIYLKNTTETENTNLNATINKNREKLAAMQNELDLNKQKLDQIKAKSSNGDIALKEQLLKNKLELTKGKLIECDKEYQAMLTKVNDSKAYTLSTIDTIKLYFEFKANGFKLKQFQEKNQQLRDENEVLERELKIYETKKILCDTKNMSFDESFIQDDEALKNVKILDDITMSIDIENAENLNDEFRKITEEEIKIKNLINSNLKAINKNLEEMTGFENDFKRFEAKLGLINYNDNRYLYIFERNWFNENMTKFSNGSNFFKEAYSEFDKYLNNQKERINKEIQSDENLNNFVRNISELKAEIKNTETELKSLLNTSRREEKSEQLIENMIKEQETLVLKIIKNNQALEQKFLQNRELLSEYEQKLEKRQINENHVTEKYKNTQNKLASLLNDIIFLNESCIKAEEDIRDCINLHDKLKTSKIKKEEILARLNNLMLENTDIINCQGDMSRELKNVEREKNDLIKIITAKQNILDTLEPALYKKNKKLGLLNEKLEIEAEMQISCDCLTDHKCGLFCKSCPDAPCKHKAGHNGDHLCAKENHSCLFKCAISGCANLCQKQIDHEDEHRCYDSHLCKKLCDVCPENCCLTMTEPHSKHQCRATKCKKKCILCLEECYNANHFHDNEAESVSLVNSTSAMVTVKKHLCGKEHNCTSMCNSPGVCFITYEELTKEYVDHSGLKCNYIYLKPISDNKKCTKFIEANQVKHTDYHSCKEQHRCETRCPECGSVCKHEYGHSDSIQHDFVHRNKEFCYFTNTTGEDIVIEDDTGKRTYKVKDQAIVENCNSSCKRRGRGHIHLLKCLGGVACRKNLHQYVVHSTKKYIGFEGEEFDEINCKDFWEYFKIKNPIKQLMGHENLLNSINKCSFYCPFCYNLANDKISFCRDICGHSNSNQIKDHDFECDCKDTKTVYTGLDLCFVIDITASMGEFIERSKKSILKITENVKKYLTKIGSNINSLKIGVVGYRDHMNVPVTLNSNFSTPDQAMKFLESLETEGNNDNHEATVDGLYEALTLSWRKETEKLLFLVLDYPPHGKEFGSYGDNSPNGCSCGRKISTMLESLDKLGVKIKMMKLTSCLEKTEIEFKKFHKDIETVGQEDCSVNFEKSICNMVVKSLVDKETSVVKLV
jgi:hypothetical protein